MKVGVAKETAPPMAEVMQKNAAELSAEENAGAFSYVDYLLTQHDPQKFNDLVKKLKSKVPTREALKEVYGMSPMEFGRLRLSCPFCGVPLFAPVSRILDNSACCGGFRRPPELHFSVDNWRLRAVGRGAWPSLKTSLVEHP